MRIPCVLPSNNQTGDEKPKSEMTNDNLEQYYIDVEDKESLND